MEEPIRLAQEPTIERVTPTGARAILRGNRHNRNMRPPRVRELAGAMQRGEWELNGETIKIASDGTLLDGQHRLAAVIESGVAIETVVMRGLPPEAQETVDTGRRRRVADVLTIAGYPDAHALAAALNVLHRYRTGQRIDFSRAAAPTPQQALSLLEEAPEIIDSVRVARRVTKEIGGPIGVFAALHCVFHEIYPAEANEFFARLEDGVELQRGDPIWHLRRHVLRPRVDRSYAQSPMHVTALTIKAFNLRRTRRSIDLLSYKATERFPEIDLPLVSA